MRFPTVWYVRPAEPRSAYAYAQSGQSLCLSLESFMAIGLLTGRRLGFLCLGVGG